MKKTISLLLALLMLVSLFAAMPLTANAEDESKVTLTSKQGFFDDYTKSYKKGDYKIKVTVTAAGNKDYLPLTLTKTVKVRIK